MVGSAGKCETFIMQKALIPKMKKRNASARRGRVDMDTLAIAVIVLIIIVVVIFIFRGQISNLARGYTDVGNQQIESAKGNKCVTFLSDRKCQSEKPGNGWNAIAAPKDAKDGWSDCETTCWEKS